MAEGAAEEAGPVHHIERGWRHRAVGGLPRDLRPSGVDCGWALWLVYTGDRLQRVPNRPNVSDLARLVTFY